MRTGSHLLASRALRIVAIYSLFALQDWHVCQSLGESTSPKTSAPRAADAFFTSSQLCTFQVDLGPAEYRALSQNSRKYVPGRVKVDGRVFERVGVRLKGSGTFQPISGHPNLALKFNWQDAEQEFAGVTKLFLNNSTQDPTFLSELVASGAFADAGVPVPRITHARVQLNGRELGVCVVAEAVNKRFLKRHFGNTRGNLYEGSFQDIRARLEQDNGEPSNRADLGRLAAAAQKASEDSGHALSVVLDTEEFLNFIAVEMIIANWDGYVLHQNNYRIYHNPDSDRMAFIPHGVDNAFFESGLSVVPPRKSILAAALLATSADREAYRRRVAKLVTVVFDPERIQRRVSAAVAKLKQGATAADAQAVDSRAALFLRRVQERARHLESELAGIRPGTPSFNWRGIAPLEGWTPKPDWNNSPVQRLLVQGKPLLSVHATNNFCFGSWRLPVWLPAGKYRIEGLTKTVDVSGLPSRTGSGAGVRVLGTMRGGGVQGTEEWTPVQHQFVVQEGCEWIELIAELRAFQGDALFDPSEFRLVRLLP